MATLNVPAHMKAYLLKYAGKKSSVQMAKECRMSRSNIYTYAAILKISLTLDTQKERFKKIEDAIRKYYGRMTFREIGEMIGESSAAVAARFYKVQNELSVKQHGEVRISKMVNGVEVFDYNAYKNWVI